MDKKSYDLKLISKKRIIDDIVKNSVKRSTGLGTVLILDEETSLTLNNFVSLPDLIENGITVIENITKKRKGYKNFISIYLLSPTKENIDMINDDFTGKKLYKELNIYFTSRISDDNFSYLKNKKGILSAKIMNEINLNFDIKSNCIFTSKKSDDFENKIDSIISVVSTFRNISSVEILKLEKDIYKNAEEIFTGLCKRISDILPLIKPGNINGEEGNLTIIILERGFDIVSPLLHDFYYENLLLDLMNLDFENIIIKNKVYKINDNDKIFNKYKYSFINKAMKGIDLDFKTFMKENATAKVQKKKDLNINEMQDVLGSINNYNEQVAQFGCHLGLFKLILEKIENENIKQITDIELAIVTAINDNGSKIDSNKRIEMAKNEMKSAKIENRDLTLDLRLALLTAGSVHRDVTKLADTLSNQSKNIFFKYINLVNKYGKYWPEQVKTILLNKVKERYNNSETSLERYLTKIEYLLGEYLINNNEEQFIKKTFGKKTMSYKPNTLFKAKIKSKNLNKNKVIIFINEGISLLEIRSLKNLQSKMNDSFEFIFGADLILTPDLFLKSFVDKN